MPDHRRRHEADRTGAGDQHVLAQHGERQRRVHGVAERIEDRGHVAVDGRVVQPHVGHRQRQVLGERARAIDADALRVLAQVPAAGQAVAATAADDMAFAADDVARPEVGDVRADRDDLADKLVPDHHRHRNRFLRPGVPVVDVYVGPADAGASDLDQHVVDADLRLGHILQPQPLRLLPLHQRLHSLLYYWRKWPGRALATARWALLTIIELPISLRYRVSPGATSGACGKDRLCWAKLTGENRPWLRQLAAASTPPKPVLVRVIVIVRRSAAYSLDSYQRQGQSQGPTQDRLELAYESRREARRAAPAGTSVGPRKGLRYAR